MNHFKVGLNLYAQLIVKVLTNTLDITMLLMFIIIDQH